MADGEKQWRGVVAEDMVAPPSWRGIIAGRRSVPILTTLLRPRLALGSPYHHTPSSPRPLVPPSPHPSPSPSTHPFLFTAPAARLQLKAHSLKLITNPQHANLNHSFAALSKHVELLDLLCVLRRVGLQLDRDQVPVLLDGRADGGEDVERRGGDWALAYPGCD